MGGSPALPATDFLVGGRRSLAAWLFHLLSSIAGTLQFFFLIFLLRALLRREWLAGVAFVGLFVALQVLGSPHPWIDGASQVAIYGIAVVVVLRFGLVALAAGIFAADLTITVPVAAGLSTWYAGSTALVFASVLGLAVWGFLTSLGGRRLWKGELFE
jgi:hypothetical protein